VACFALVQNIIQLTAKYVAEIFDFAVFQRYAM